MFFFDDTEEWVYVAEINAIIFFVAIHNLLYKCVITKKFIEEYFGKCHDSDECLEIARTHSGAITDLISKKLDKGEHKAKDAVYLN